jgi:hypothetical protein
MGTIAMPLRRQRRSPGFVALDLWAASDPMKL